MRHHKNNRKFGRERNVRAALIKSLMFALLRDGKIKTTEAKAKELRPIIEKLISKARTGTPAAERLVASRLGNRAKAGKLMKEIAPKYKDRNGGYTRIIKLGQRKSDGSSQAVIELI